MGGFALEPLVILFLLLIEVAVDFLVPRRTLFELVAPF